MVRPVQHGPLTGLVAQLVVLAALAVGVGLGGGGWTVGVVSSVAVSATLSLGMSRYGSDGLGPADRVTLTRATIAVGVAALTADSFSRPVPVTAVAVLAALALVLDAVDGWVARRTGTASRLGATFDMEVDAFLILVLSVYVARSTGPWVLAIGAARYVLLVARWGLPWLHGPVPPLYWRKVVAATQGIVLTCAAAEVLPVLWTEVALAASLALLSESFGREVWWLRRHRHVVPRQVLVPVRLPQGSRGHPAVADGVPDG
jgi:phosphatidylglycerophosphate synthase